MKRKSPVSFKFLFLFLLAALTLSSIAWYSGVYSPRPKAALGANGVNVLYSPSSGSFAAGADQNITVTLTPVTATDKISGIDLTFVAGGNLSIKDITTPAALPTELIKSVNGTTARIAYVSNVPNAQLSSTVQFQITVTPSAAGSGTLVLDFAKSQVVGTVSTTVFGLDNTITPNSYAITSSGGGGGTATPTPTTPSGGTVTPTPTTVVSPTPLGPILNFRMRFQGVIGMPTIAEPMPVKFRLVNGTASVDGVVSVTPDANGVWSGTTSVPATPARTYSLFVKGPRHLQKKICSYNPRETAIGTYRCSNGSISIAAGTNTLDLSGITMLVGDLPDQDGTVDSYDTSYIRQSLGSTAGEDVSIADLNRDGIVDTQDMSLVIQALNVKYDEE